ncbi:MAG: hypothetical protein DSZ23_01010 [Thermodesulfatator sp.]|nr:MAG: hypothetical protein DSZ23_01010 [Thermodesulfatator sp.]
MEILLHVCCGPCSVYPVSVLKAKGMEPMGFFFNPNIHPFRELERRITALEQVSDALDFPVVWDSSGYGLKGWLHALEGRFGFEERCPVCYRIRLEETARVARQMNIRTISTTLLYSRYQRHEAIVKTGREAARRYGLDFYYEDFRKGWQQGIDASIELRIYRQPYCGCVFSEAERYSKRMDRLFSRLEAINSNISDRAENSGGMK